MKKLVLTVSCLILTLAAKNSMATLTAWDPQGTTGANPVTTSLSGTWENADWSTSQTGQATPQAWVEDTAAVFAVHSGSSTPSFTVTMNANHTVAGFFNGPLTPDPCNAHVSGTGTMTMGPANLNGFDVTEDPTTDYGYITINNVIAGASTAGICPQATGQIFLNGANTYSGGTFLGYTGSHWDGIVNFNSSASFGTGAIFLSGISPGFTGALVAEGSAAITIPNPFTNCESGDSSLNIVGILPVGSPPSGVTFSGPWVLSGGQGNTAGANGLVPVLTGAGTSGYGPVYIGSGGVANDLVTISGIISGTNGLSKFNAGMLELTGANTYGTAGAPITTASNAWTTVSNGWLLLDNANPSTTSATGVSSVLVASGGTLAGYGSASGPVTVNSGGVISATNLAVGGTASLSTGALTIATGAIDICHISSSTVADKISITGTASLGNITLTLVTLTSANKTGALASTLTSGTTWPVLTSTGTLSVGTVALNTAGATGTGGGTFATFVSGNTLYLGYNVTAPSGLTVTPAYFDVASGGTAHINATLTTPGSPTPTYTWTLNGGALTADASGQGTANLTIVNANDADAGSYGVTVANPLGNVTGSSTLVVVDPSSYSAATTTMTLKFSGPVGQGYRVWDTGCNPSVATLTGPLESTWNLLTSGTFASGVNTVSDTSASCTDEIYVVTVP